MTGANSLTIRSARLRGRPGLFDIVVSDGVIESITSLGETGPDAVEVDAAGNLVTESFVNTHLHLDKVFTLAQLGDAAL
ncbi:MAG: cytosine deaminase, partial [Actinomycetota bacterium]|nr:cytosine deaminase [Actinomycetota bacterium]